MAKVIRPTDPPADDADAPPAAPEIQIQGSPLPSGDQIAAGAPIVQLTFEQLNQLIERAAAVAGGARGAGSDELKLAASALGQLGDEVRRTVRRSNATHPGISAFSYPEGEELKPKEHLAYETYFCGAIQREDQLTPTEIDLYNKFDRPMEARDGSWRATLEKNGSKRRLHIVVPAKTNDDLASLPPLTQILSELLFGSEVADPSKSMQRLLDAEKRIAELTAKLEALTAPRDMAPAGA